MKWEEEALKLLEDSQIGPLLQSYMAVESTLMGGGGHSGLVWHPVIIHRIDPAILSIPGKQTTG
jgi:hypothetical protein